MKNHSKKDQIKYLFILLFILFLLFLFINNSSTERYLGKVINFNSLDYSGNIYYISSAGSDSNSGNFSFPFHTIQKCADVVIPGDVCIVQPGRYTETVTLSRGGNLNERVTFFANGSAVVKRFNVRNSSIVIDGFTFSNISGQYIGYVDTRDVPNLTDLHFKNNILLEGIYAISSNVTLQSINETQILITAPDGNFSEKGFGLNYFAVICNSLANVSNTFSLSMLVGDNASENQISAHEYHGYNVTIPENMGQAYCLMYVNTYGFLITANNFTIVNNTLNNLWGNFITIAGSNGLVENNTETNLNGWDAFRVFGENHTFRKNLVLNGRLASGNSNHPDIFQTWSSDNTTIVRNIIFENNFILNVESQICMQENSQQSPYMYNWTVRNNVFAIPLNESSTLMVQANIANYSPQQWYKNTFFRIGGTGGEGSAISGRMDVIRDNAFIAGAGNRDSQGWYSSADYSDYNYVSKEPPTYNEKFAICAEPNVSDGYNFCEWHGINGGDPLLQDIENILGPDNLPWTSDDGLIPLAGSLFCNSASDGEDIGAYECAGCVDDNPIAFFNTNYLSGYSPLTVVLNATNSQSCDGSLNYLWDFGDGQTSSSQVVSHTFTTGTYRVNLTITNSNGKSDSYSRELVIYPATEAGLVLWLNLDNVTSDLSGRYHQFYWDDNESYSQGISGSAAQFNNSRKGAIYGSHSDDLDGFDEVSFSFWAKKENVGETEVVLIKHVVYNFAITSNGFTYYLNSNNDTSTTTHRVSNNDLNWHYYSLVYNATSKNFYFDGILNATVISTGTVHHDASRPVTIGRDPWGEVFNGNIDEFKLYERALSQDEIYSLFTGQPTIKLNYPLDNHEQNSDVGSISFNFTLNTTRNINNCSLFLNGLQYSSVSVNNSSVDYIIDSNFNSGNYTWAINCYYSGGNISSTEIREFTIPDADSSSSDQQSRGSGGSGGGGGSSRNIPTDAKIEGKIYSIFTISEEDLKNKNTHSLKKNQALKFTIASAEHLLFFEKVEKNSIIFTVKSEPQQVILNVGEEKNFELNGDNYYDLFIRLDSIFGEDIRVSIQEVHSLISPENNLEVDISSNIDPEENENWYLFNYLIVGIIILVIFMIYMYFRRVRSIMAISRMLGDVERRQILSDSNSMGASVDDSFNQEK